MALEKQVTSGESIAPATKSIKKISISIFASFLFIAAAVAVAVTVASSRNNSDGAAKISAEVKAVLSSACSSTLHPELCISAVVKRPEAAQKVVDYKSVIMLTLEITKTIFERNFFLIRKLASSKRRILTKRMKNGLQDCLELLGETLDEIQQAKEELSVYPGGGKSLKAHADDLKTLLSSAMSNEETCLAGFSNAHKDRELRYLFIGGEEKANHMCGNTLAMIKNFTDTHMHNSPVEKRHLTEDHDVTNGGIRWPEWVSPGDKRLLQDSTVTADTVVATDGSGNYRTVSEAVARAPAKSARRYVIRIKAGVYRENVDVPKNKTCIMFLGDGPKTTIITGNRNVFDGETTFRSATVAAVGAGFLARGITFENTAGPAKHQAVALRVGSDLSAFYDCDVIGYQDTLYVHNNRVFMVKCLIVGTVDFIFGNAAAVIQDCDIHARRPAPGQKIMITAQGRTDPNQNTGIVLQRCRISATSDLERVKGLFPTYLGRPWKEYSRTVVMQSVIGDLVNPEGWHEWSGLFALNTLYYGEYLNSGAGSSTAKRVSWSGYRVITEKVEAEGFAPGNFLGGAVWLHSTGFPYRLGL